MCGIAGAFGPAVPAATRNMDAALAGILHRGPDSSGRYLSPDGACLLGHRRLSILDLSDAAGQPMRRKGLVLAHNGEIYNHAALRAEMGDSFRFSTQSDTETILALLQRGVEPALAKLDGMFALACYSESDGKLMLCRDPLGIKQLYYAQDSDSTVYFCSEIKGLLALAPQLPRKVDPETLALYLTYENYPQGRSLFAGISMLRPGEVLRLSLESSGKVTLAGSFLPSDEEVRRPTARGHQETVALLRAELEKAVAAHLQSDVSVGVYLSGGVDSSLVAALAARHGCGPLAFTGYFETDDGYYDERPLARLAAQHCGLQLNEIPIRPRDFQDNFDKVIYTLDEPRMGMGAFAQYMVAATASQQLKVILAGHGGDELFGGYPLFKAVWLLAGESGWLQRMRCLAGLKPKEYPWVLDQLAEAATNGGLRFAPRIFGRASFSRDFQSRGFGSALEALRRYYEAVYLPGLLVVEDKISMAWSLETRVPLWSKALRAFAAGLPAAELVKNGELKSLLKEAAGAFLPRQLLDAPKRGFPTPLRLWFRGELFDYVRQRLLAGNFARAMMPEKELAGLLSSHRNIPFPFSLDERRAHKIWMLLSLQSWSEQYKVAL